MNYFIYFTSKQTKFRKTRDTVWHESFAIFLAIRKNEFPQKKKVLMQKLVGVIWVICYLFFSYALSCLFG